MGLPPTAHLYKNKTRLKFWVTSCQCLRSNWCTTITTTKSSWHIRIAAGTRPIFLRLIFLWCHCIATILWKAEQHHCWFPTKNNLQKQYDAQVLHFLVWSMAPIQLYGHQRWLPVISLIHTNKSLTCLEVWSIYFSNQRIEHLALSVLLEDSLPISWQIDFLKIRCIIFVKAGWPF